MSEPDDNKIRSITYLVRSLIVVTLTTVGLSILLLCNAFASRFTNETPQMPGCAVVTAPCGMNTDSGNYRVNGKDGKTLFKTQCSSCHTATDKNGTGPGLKGVLDRIPGGNWKYTFVRNSDSMHAAGDPYSLVLFESYKTRCMPFPQLTNDEIDAILGYTNQ